MLCVGAFFIDGKLIFACFQVALSGERSGGKVVLLHRLSRRSQGLKRKEGDVNIYLKWTTKRFIVRALTLPLWRR